jgi:carbon storage regulator
MLVLSRRAGESVVIDGDITVTVVDVGRSGQVRLGIQAPRHRRVFRQELVDEVRAANAASLAAGDDQGALARAQDLLGATRPITEERR